MNKPKALVGSDGYHVVMMTNTRTSKMSRLMWKKREIQRTGKRISLREIRRAQSMRFLFRGLRTGTKNLRDVNGRLTDFKKITFH